MNMHGKLTPREEEVIELLIEGYSDKQIALALGIRCESVRRHLWNIREPLGIANRVQLAVWYVRKMGRLVNAG